VRHLRGAGGVDRRRAARQDHGPGLPRPELLGRDGVRHDLAVDLRLAHAAGDELGVLGAEVDDEHGVFGRCGVRAHPAQATGADRCSERPNLAPSTAGGAPARRSEQGAPTLSPAPGAPCACRAAPPSCPQPPSSSPAARPGGRSAVRRPCAADAARASCRRPGAVPRRAAAAVATSSRSGDPCASMVAARHRAALTPSAAGLDAQQTWDASRRRRRRPPSAVRAVLSAAASPTSRATRRDDHSSDHGHGHPQRRGLAPYAPTGGGGRTRRASASRSSTPASTATHPMFQRAGKQHGRRTTSERLHLRHRGTTPASCTTRPTTPTRPARGRHGTHVAGIAAASRSRRPRRPAARAAPREPGRFGLRRPACSSSTRNAAMDGSSAPAQPRASRRASSPARPTPPVRRSA
jgi:hypothetical protein